MKRLILVLGALSALSACSEHRERQISTSGSRNTPDLTLPDTGTQVLDTSTRSPGHTEQPVSTVEQESPRAHSFPKATTTHRPKHSVVASRRSNQPSDSSIKGYAPVAANPSSTKQSSADTARSRFRDSASTTNDSAVTAVSDSALRPAADSTAAGDTIPAASRESTTAMPESSAARVDSTNSPAESTSSNSSSAGAVPPSLSQSSVAERTLATGTEIHAALDDSITSRRDTVGQQVSGHIMENVLGPDGKTLLAAGTPVRFTITSIRPSRSKSSQGRLALKAEGVAVNGQLQAVQADLKPVPRELRGRGVTGGDAAKVGGGAAAGAVVGGVVGGNTKGAVIGGVAGAAAGAVVAHQTATRDVVVKAKTPVVLVLTAPLVTP
jgi:hypothetical protein